MLEIRNKINNFINDANQTKIPLEDPEIGKFCLTNVNGAYHRAKIISNSCKSDGFYIKMFLCDHGLFAECISSDAIVIPDNLIDFLPFQAIFCSLDGLEPPDLSEEWSTSLEDQIYAVLDGFDDIYAKIRSSEKVPNRVVDISRYNVTLINGLGSDSIDLCQLLVDKNLAKYKKGYIVKTVTDGSDADDENWDNECDPNKRNPWKNPNEESSESQFNIEDVQLPDEINNQTDENKNVDIPSTNNKIYKHQLRNMQLSHYITWQQSASVIILSIQANDTAEYDLNVGVDQVTIW